MSDAFVATRGLWVECVLWHAVASVASARAAPLCHRLPLETAPVLFKVANVERDGLIYKPLGVRELLFLFLDD